MVAKAKIRIGVRVKGKKRYFTIRTNAKTPDGIRKAKYRHLHTLGYNFAGRKAGWTKQAIPKAPKPVAKAEAIPTLTKQAKSVTISNIVVSDWEGDNWAYPDITALASPELSDKKIIEAVDWALRLSKRKVLTHEGYDYANASNVEIGIQNVQVDNDTKLANSVIDLERAIKQELDTLGFTHSRTSHKR